MKTRQADTLSERIARCRICVESPLGKPLPHEPNPVCVMSETARVCISGQAPGVRVHKSGRPFTDPSGDRLRDWMDIGEDVFYDATRLAIVPMGFCFPGHDTKGGDLPPRRECALTWHRDVFGSMPQLRIILAVGQYAQAFHLGAQRRMSLTETVANWRGIVDAAGNGPVIYPMPHPSWRNNGWLKRNPWFETELLPHLRKNISQILSDQLSDAK